MCSSSWTSAILLQLRLSIATDCHCPALTPRNRVWYHSCCHWQDASWQARCTFCGPTPRLRRQQNACAVTRSGRVQETLSLRSRSCFPNFGTNGLALVNQIFESDFCLAGVPLRMTFADYESTFSKPRKDKNKTTDSNYEKVLDCSRSRVSKLQIRISRPRTETFRLRLPKGPGSIKNTTTYYFTITVAVHNSWHSSWFFPRTTRCFRDLAVVFCYRRIVLPPACPVIPKSLANNCFVFQLYSGQEPCLENLSSRFVFQASWKTKKLSSRFVLQLKVVFQECPWMCKFVFQARLSPPFCSHAREKTQEREINKHYVCIYIYML